MYEKCNTMWIELNELSRSPMTMGYMIVAYLSLYSWASGKKLGRFRISKQSDSVTEAQLYN